ncbi:hypothetical protein [Streptomyces sp. NPDC005799]|uniref:hypothetical protein n=1 Tax=Streptomyces sp. NPDC005799 TaxID=3154678 RepID=UPI0033D93EC5
MNRTPPTSGSSALSRDRARRHGPPGGSPDTQQLVVLLPEDEATAEAVDLLHGRSHGPLRATS